MNVRICSMELGLKIRSSRIAVVGQGRGETGEGHSKGNHRDSGRHYEVCIIDDGRERYGLLINWGE